MAARSTVKGSTTEKDDDGVTWETHPVTPDRFEDFADVINPNRRKDSCWCLSHRVRQADIRELGDGDRETTMRALCAQPLPPGCGDLPRRDGRSGGSTSDRGPTSPGSPGRS